MGMPINQVRPKGKPRSERPRARDLQAHRLRAPGRRFIGEHQLWSNVDYLKAAIADAMDDGGVRYFLHARAVDAVVEGKPGHGGGRRRRSRASSWIKAKAIIDCTGDADVAHYAGAETMKEAGNLSPMTLLLKVTNVDLPRAKTVKLGAVADKARAKYPLIPKTWALRGQRSVLEQLLHQPFLQPRFLPTTTARTPSPSPRPRSSPGARPSRWSRRCASSAATTWRSIELIGTSPQICVRETRRVKGVYVLTEDDALQGRTFEDAIAWRSGFLDVGYSRSRGYEDPRRALPGHPSGEARRPARRRPLHLGHARRRLGRKEHGQLYGDRARRGRSRFDVRQEKDRPARGQRPGDSATRSGRNRSISRWAGRIRKGLVLIG